MSIRQSSDKVLERKRLIRGLKFALGIGLLVALVLSVNTGELMEVLKRAKLPWIFVCIAAAFVVFDFQGWLLGVLTAPFAKIPHKKLFAFTLIGRFFSLFLPSSIGGDVIKGIYLFPYFEQRSQAFAAIVMQRGVGGLSTLLIALIAGYVYLPKPYSNSIMLISLALVLGGVASVTLYYRYKRHLWDKIKVHSEPATSSSGAFRFLYRFAAALLAYDDARRAVIVAFVLSGAGTLLSVGLYMLVAYTLQVPLTFSQALVASTVTMLGVILPLTPGGIGVGEGLFIVMAGVMGVASEHALAIMLLGRFVGYVAAAPGGVLYMVMSASEARKPT